ncbi:MAG: hypothetical protein ABI840_12140, partial [bacterium]
GIGFQITPVSQQSNGSTQTINFVTKNNQSIETKKGIFGHNGLNNIYRRAAELKGNATITSEIGKGTMVMVEFQI